MIGTKARIFTPITAVSLEELVPANHFYRHLDRVVDLSFVRDLVKETYAERGRPSIDPVVFFKLQLVMFFNGIRSERQLMVLAADWFLSPVTKTTPRLSPLQLPFFFLNARLSTCAKSSLHLEEITIFVDPQLLFLDSRQRECGNYSPLYPSSEESLRHMAKATTTIRQMVTRIGIASRYILVAHIHVIGPCYRYPALPGSRPNDGAFTPGIPVYRSVLVW